MLEVTLEQALSHISSSSQRSRADGLKDLKHFLIVNKNSKKLRNLGEKGYQGIFDALFQLLAVEKLGYARAKTPGTRRTALTRIEACATTVRITVEVIGREIKARILFAVIDHIIDSLYDSDSGWWQHISGAYLKALRILLEYPPHVEHLSRQKWQKTCNFCINALIRLGSDGDIQGSSGLTPLQSLSLDSASHASSVEPSSVRRKHSVAGSYGNRIELEILIRLLCSSPAAPLVDEGANILNPLLDYLLAVHSPSSASPYILGALNTVLSRTLISNVSLSQMTLISILPFLRRSSIPKSSALREEMMVTLELARSVLPFLKDVEFMRLLDDSLPSLVDHLQREYLKLSNREFLHLEDLTFTSPDINVPMGIPGMGPRLGITRAEETWTLIRAIATFSTMLDGKATSPVPQAEDDEFDAERPLKKLFKLTRLNGLLRDSHAAIGPEKVFALQLLPFLVREGNVVLEDLQSLLTRLNANIMDDHDETQSWTMVAIANIAGHKDASSAPLKTLWSQTWSLATQCLSSPRTSRAACFLIAAMVHHNLHDEATEFNAVDTMLSAVEMNGSSGLTDAALLMWSCLLKKSAVSQPARNKQISAQICSWLRSAWVYDSMTDKVHASHLSTFALPQEIVSLLLACTNRHITPPSSQLHGAVSRISRAWFQFQLNSDLLKYLFDTEVPVSNLPHPSYSERVDFEDLGNSRPHDGIVLELLHAKATQLSRFWESLLTEEARMVTDGVIHMLTSLCVISSLFVRLTDSSSSKCHRELQQITDSLWLELCSFFEKQDIKYFMAALEILAPLILPLKIPFPDNCIVNASLFLSLRDCGAKIKPFLESLLRTSFHTGPIISQTEAVDIDMMVDGPHHFNTPSDPDLGFLREDYPLLIYPDWKMVARATIIQWLVLLEMTEDNPLTITGSVVDLLTSLKGADVLIWRPVFLNFFDTSLSIARADACRLIEHFADNCLMVWSIQRSEAAPSVCIHLVTVILPLLSLDDSDDLEKASHDLLDWFSQSLVVKGQGTPRTLARITTLYHGIMALPSTLSSNELRRSYQRKLIEVLLEGDLKVKYHLSKLLPSAFDRIPPDTHDGFFDDIFEGFPLYSDWIEGTSVRLFLLGQLASHCGSVLRRSIYRIFETAGQIPDSSHYAKRCLETASRALGLGGAKDLFRIFASQLLYTWLEPQVGQARQSLASIPFTIFDYFSLKDMLLEVQDEIIGQIILRGQEDEMAEISSVLEMPFTDLLTASFARAEAYVIASSISVPPLQSSQQTGGEKRIKALLGKTQFGELLIRSFPSIVAILVQRVDEPAIESLQRVPGSNATSTWKAIDLKSHSEISIPTGQQPCFRSKYLYDELSYICKRANIPVAQLWNSALFCYVARSLMDTVQPALGSLQACAVLRKLKMLICISGSAVFGGYSCPMILHFLKQFLTDQCCGGDALGIFWYVCENRKNGSFFGPSFEIGLAISSLVSLHIFIHSSKKTVERRACSESLILRQREFSEWFSQHLGASSEYICGSDDQVVAFFQKLILLTTNSDGWGRSHKETAGGQMLLLLLEDQASPSPILVHPAKEQLFNLLSEDFQRETQPKWDILGNDPNAIAHALNAWRCCPTRGPATPYKLWVARALGRSYAASGELNRSLLREQKGYPHGHSHDYPCLTSKIAIVKALRNALMSSIPEHVGLAERTFQMIVQRLGSNSISIECRKAISELLHRSFTWAPYSCPTISLTKAELEQLNHGIRWNASSMASEWARETSILLCLTKPNDLVVGTLPKILHDLPGLAEHLLPYVVHDVLVSEFDGKQTSRFRLSAVFNQAFRHLSNTTIPHIKLMIRCLLYLRRQVYPKESNADDRDFWLDIDYQLAASAARHCEMYKTALLLIEIHFSHLATASRRSSAGVASTLPAELLAQIYSSIDDPDLNHGLEEDVSPEAILRALSTSGSAVQKLSFQTATYDADIRLLEGPAGVTELQLVKALNETNFQGLANDILSASNSVPDEEAMLSTALYLQQWDIPVPSTYTTPTSNVFKVLKCINTQNDDKLLHRTIDDSFLAVSNQLMSTHSLSGLKDCMRALASLAEIDEIISSDPGKIRDEWDHMIARNHWLKFESFADIKELLFCREALFSSLARSSSTNSLFKVNPRISRELQFRTIQESLRISRDHDELQVAMKSAVLLMKLAPICNQQGLSVNIAAQFELAQVLWDQ
ncbi:Serine/threonine-protein kinase tel1, partial [Ascosphaera aggregata]